MTASKRLLALLLLALGFATPLCAQEIAAWFQSSPSAPRYGGIRIEAERLGSALSEEGLPDRPLAERLAEGAGKRVDPLKLLAVLRDEAARLRAVADLLRARDLLSSSNASSLAAEGSLLLRAGVSPALMGEALDAAVLLKPGSPARRAFAALAAVVSINARFGLDEGSERTLALALVVGGLPEERFDALVSLFARGRARGLGTDRIASLVAEMLRGGGSLDRIERELDRRTRKQ